MNKCTHRVLWWALLWALPWALGRLSAWPWSPAEALGSPGALRRSGPAGALGPSGGLPWAFPWALGPSLDSPMGSFPWALVGPWALRGPCGDRAQPGPLQIQKN